MPHMVLANRHTVGKHAQRIGGGVLLVLLGLAVSGCSPSVRGHWKLDRSLPNRDVFAIDDAHFASDGTYSATVTIEGKTTHQKGEYNFNGFKLTLRPNGGGQHRWDALVHFRTLEIFEDERKAFLKKAK